MKKINILLFSIITLFLITGCGNKNDLTVKNNKTNKKENIKIVATDASKLELEDYDNGLISMKKPKGWEVSAGGMGLFYSVRVYDPNNTNNQVYLMLKLEPLLKNNKTKEFYQNYYKMSGYNKQFEVLAEAIVLEKGTTEEFFEKFNSVVEFMKNDPSLSSLTYPYLGNFKAFETLESGGSMKSVAKDSKILRATFTGENGKEGEGMFMASIVTPGSQVSNGIDFAYYTIYDLMLITSDKDEYINYKDKLLESVNSIEFSQEYLSEVDKANKQATNAIVDASKTVQKAFDSYNKAWESRQKTYDITSQKYSDATLGYERVYDTETGEIYKAYNGFTDEYQGKRYKTITDDMYTEKVTGYLEKIK